MSLANVHIEALLTQKISDYFSTTPAYETLRQHCLARILLKPIMERVDESLQIVLAADKHQAQKRLEEDAYRNQLEHDQREETSDTKQERDDQHRTGILLNALRTKQSGMTSYVIEIRDIESRIGYLEQQLIVIEQHVRRKRREAQRTPTTHHPDSIPDHGTTHDHSHPAATHTHAHPSTKEEEAIRALNRQHASLSLELTRLRLQLSEQRLRKTRLQEEYEEASREIKEQLPERQKQRQERACARAIRAQARLKADPDFIQLSADNRRILQKKISEQHVALDKQYRQLKRQAEQACYPLYLTQLQQQLSTMPYLPWQANQALEQIIACMQQYLSEKDAEQRERIHLATLQHQLATLELELKQKQERRAQLQANIPQLQSQNAQLAQENQQLDQTMQKRRALNKRIIIGGMISFLLTLALAAVPALLITAPASTTLFPLLFIPAAIAGLAMAGLFIAAAIYGVKNILDARKKARNEQAITDNIATMERESSNIQALISVEIPQLYTRIGETQTTIRAAEYEITMHEQSAARALAKASTITVDHPLPAFFDVPHPPGAFPLPSAPPLVEETPSGGLTFH
ncbi:hypothetical protein [Legionella nagasakiensis]|uniref:hypothetical protein n=1 Tax=Legionella nagasakiensis TaxID=535290 RepID=UPI001054F9AC|nr:hypothetical protein [Legionella nagasakiensis]